MDPKETLNVFQYTSYRSCTEAWLAEDEPHRTRRWLAKRIRCAPSLVTAILKEPDEKGHRKLTRDKALGLSEAIGLDEEEKTYFLALVDFEQAETRRGKDEAWRRISAMRRFQAAHELIGEEFQIFSEWYHAAILELSRCQGFKSDPRWIAKALHPEIKPSEAQRSLNLLVRFGFLSFGPDGTLTPIDALVADSLDGTSEQAKFAGELRTIALYALHRTLLDRGKDALDRYPREERFFNAITAAIPRAQIPAAIALLQRFEAEFLELCNQGPGDRVYHMNVQLFPASDWTNQSDED